MRHAMTWILVLTLLVFTPLITAMGRNNWRATGRVGVFYANQAPRKGVIFFFVWGKNDAVVCNIKGEMAVEFYRTMKQLKSAERRIYIEAGLFIRDGLVYVNIRFWRLLK